MYVIYCYEFNWIFRINKKQKDPSTYKSKGVQKILISDYWFIVRLTGQPGKYQADFFCDRFSFSSPIKDKKTYLHLN